MFSISLDLNVNNSVHALDDSIDLNTTENFLTETPRSSENTEGERVKGCFACFRGKLPTCPTPDLSFFTKHLSSAWTTFREIEWAKQISSIRDHKWIVLMTSPLSGWSNNSVLFDDIMKVISNALSAVKRFFANYSFIQRVLQSPKLFSGLSLGYGVYNLYFSIQHALAECRDYDEKVYRCLDLIEYFGSLFDNASSLILGLEEAAFISSRLAGLVPPLTAVSIALSMTAQVPKAFVWAKLKKELCVLIEKPAPVFDESIKSKKMDQESANESDESIKKKLKHIVSADTALLNRLFALKNTDSGKSDIRTKINSLKGNVGNRPALRKELLDTLKGRIKTRSDALLLSLTTTMVSAIGLGILVFTPFTLFAHLTLLVTTIFAIKYMRNERTYALEFAEKLKISSGKKV
jgi:hypothetical protein